MVRNDVLIENNKYGYVTMQNKGAMKIVNFMRKPLKPGILFSARECRVRG